MNQLTTIIYTILLWTSPTMVLGLNKYNVTRWIFHGIMFEAKIVLTTTVLYFL